MKNDGKIYLGRNGRIYGPFSPADFERMQLSGEVERYTFIWDAAGKAWKTIETPPPPLGSSGATGPAWTRIEAVCHNFHDVISGTLDNVADNGCDLVCHDHSDSPRLALNSTLVLNVIDPAKDKSMNVKTSLAEVSWRDGVWIYHLRWAKRPAL